VVMPQFNSLVASGSLITSIALSTLQLLCASVAAQSSATTVAIVLSPTVPSARSTAEIAQKEGVSHRYVARLLRLGFLAPDIIAGILAHRHPAQMIVDRLRGPIPIDWDKQRRLFGFDLGRRVR
jgi:hypothetical protein